MILARAFLQIAEYCRLLRHASDLDTESTFFRQLSFPSAENRCPAAQHAQHAEIIYHPTYMTRNLPSDVKLKLYVILSLNTTGGLKAKPLTFNSLIHRKAEPHIYNCISLNLQSLQPRIC